MTARLPRDAEGHIKPVFLCPRAHQTVARAHHPQGGGTELGGCASVDRILENPVPVTVFSRPCFQPNQPNASTIRLPFDQNHAR